MSTFKYDDNKITPVAASGVATLALPGGIDSSVYGWNRHDFFGKAGASQSVTPFVATKTGVSTNNTVDYASSVADGVYRLTHSSDSEAQTMRLDFGDSLMLNMSKGPIIRFRVKFNIANATMSADQRAVVGLASAYNATLDDVTTIAWFRIEGANLNIYVEGDDGTTDTDDQDTTVDYVDNVYQILEIDCSSLSAIRFRIYTAAGVLQGTSTVALAALAANTLVQPIVAIQRDAGTEQEVVDIDFIEYVYTRT